MVEPIIFNIPISSWATISASFATFIIAFLTWRTVNQTGDQLNLFKKQTYILQNKQNPILQIENLKIVNNYIHLTIKNIGEGNAYSIGLQSKFHLAKQHIEQIKKNEKGQLLALSSFSYDFSGLTDFFDGKSHKILSNGAVVTVSKLLKKFIILKPNSSIKIKVKPTFFVYYPFKIGDHMGRSIDLEELIDLIKLNKKKFVGFSFDLVYKNGLEDVLEPIDLFDFIFDVSRHNDLEDAFNDKIRFQINTLSLRQVEMTGLMDEKSYFGIKSSNNLFDEA